MNAISPQSIEWRVNHGQATALDREDFGLKSAAPNLTLDQLERGFGIRSVGAAGVSTGATFVPDASMRFVDDAGAELPFAAVQKHVADFLAGVKTTVGALGVAGSDFNPVEASIQLRQQAKGVRLDAPRKEPSTALQEIYRSPMALCTDLYQLSMAQAYFDEGMADTEAIFPVYFRSNPFDGGYAVACGLDTAVGFLKDFRFTDNDVNFLRSIEGNDGKPIFTDDFLTYLREMEFACDVDAVAPGTPLFPNEPLMVVKGPLIQAQLVETALLCVMNFQTLIATKASRVVNAAEGDPVLEFGLRRAQGFDGGLSAAFAAFVGGAAGTSNVMAGKVFDIPVKGTHAHSYVMAHETEMDAFEAYAKALPNNCVFLVDTYDTIEGIKKAIEVGLALKDRGHSMVGIRLDSGDLTGLSKEARTLLDDAGLADASIVASNDLDEYAIAKMKRNGAQVRVWGVGTKLVTAYDQPALGGVYKMGAIRRPGGEWEPRIKLSNDDIKVSTPGHLQVRRFFDGDRFLGDLVYDQLGESPAGTMVNPKTGEVVTLPPGAVGEDLLNPIFRQGRFVAGTMPTAKESREYCLAQMAKLPDGVKRLEDPDVYAVGLEPGLHALRNKLIAKHRPAPAAA